MLDYDSELRHLNYALRESLRVRDRDYVLDIGCGAGQTSRDAAHIANNGRVIGIDNAELSLQNARRLINADGLHNVNYVCGDAAHLPFPRASFDIAISRFGTMFFANPVAAFTGIREALRTNGRLVMMAWQVAQRNEWAVAIDRALANNDTTSLESQLAASAFSLGDEQNVRNILHSCAFVDVQFKEVHAPVYYGPDIESAFEYVSRFASVASAMHTLTENGRERIRTRLRDMLAAHLSSEGVLFDSRAWIVRARRE